MKFRFGLLKVLSIMNLVVSGGMGILVVLSLLGGVNLGSLVVLFFLGAAGIHSWLGLALHRSFRTGVPMDDQQPSGLRVIGFITAFIAFMSMASCITFLRTPDNVLADALKPMLDQQAAKQITMAQLLVVIRGMAVFMLLFAVSLMVNYINCANFLQSYLNQQREKEDQF